MLQDDILQGQIQAKTARKTGASPAAKHATRELLLLCTAASISPDGKERISRILAGTLDWGYLLGLAELNGITPLMAHNLTINGLAKRVPKHYLERLNQNYNSNLYRNVILSSELKRVLTTFNQHGIPAIVLKGTILAELLYGNPALRTVADMDILVKPENISQAGLLLLEMGYQQSVSTSWEHPFHEVPYCKLAQFPLVIELHRNLDDIKLMAAPLHEIWHRAQTLPAWGRLTMVLSPEDNLLFLANHLSKNSLNLLKSLNDIAELLKKHNGTLDWEYILKSTHSWGIETAVYYALKRSQELLGAQVPPSVMRALKPQAWRSCLLDFLVSNEFFISNTGLTKLRDETYTLVRCLMMKQAHQAALVLSRNRRHKRGAWLKTTIWIILVFGAALARNTAKIASRSLSAT